MGRSRGRLSVVKGRLRNVVAAARGTDDQRRPRDRDELERFAYAYRGVRAAAQGRRPMELGGPSLRAPDRAQDDELRRMVHALRGRAVLTDALQLGAPLEEAVVAMTRALLAGRNHVMARSVCQALQDVDQTRTAGALGAGLVAHAMGLVELAYDSFRQVPAEQWRRHVPVEYVEVALENGDRDVVSEVARMVDEAADQPPDTWVALVKVAFGAGQTDLARRLARHVDRLRDAAPESWASLAGEWSWLEPWVQREAGRVDDVEPAGALAFGVIDYKQPDRSRTSSNLGDYVQTAAALGHLLRHSGLDLVGDDELTEVARTLHGRVREDAVIDSGERQVRLQAVNRDASNLDVLADPTWMIAFGWYMHDWFGGRTDFPFHPAIRPIFISFHCNRRKMLTDEAIEYLKAHGPIGCRDWNTVDLLLSVGVPAFFSGCLTTTVRTLFPDRDLKGRKGVAYVDVKAPRGATTITQAADEVRDVTLGANLLHAVDLLERYRSEFAEVVTSRLHCYLPAWSIGAEVDFRPHNRADVRFSGLMDAGPADLVTMRERITGLLETVTTALIEGVPEAEVYRRWREVCEPEVELARQRHTAVVPFDGPSFDVDAQCQLVRASSVTVPATEPRAGEEVDVALALDGNLKDELDVVVTAMLDNTARPLHLWILCRDHDESDQARFSRAFPEVTTTWLPCDEVDYGPVLGMLKHITVSTMDRLLLPDLLPDLDRIVYHDVDALPLGDVGELAAWDLAGAPIAARSAVARHVSSGYDTIHNSARRLRDDPRAASDLLHRMYAIHPWDFSAFNAGILVMDLSRMRADEFSKNFLPFVERYGMNDQEVLNCYAGSRRTELTSAWNALPTQEPVRDPKIIHWAGPLKPWLPSYVAYRDRWQRYETLAAVRRERASSVIAENAVTR